MLSWTKLNLEQRKHCHVLIQYKRCFPERSWTCNNANNVMYLYNTKGACFLERHVIHKYQRSIFLAMFGNCSSSPHSRIQYSESKLPSKPSWYIFVIRTPCCRHFHVRCELVITSKQITDGVKRSDYSGCIDVRNVQKWISEIET